MISVCGQWIAHLGGGRGDRLSLGRDQDGFVHGTDLGWDEAGQVTPQRRLLATGEALFVLEPQTGCFLDPPFRVRRLDWEGNELDVQEGEGEEAECGLCYQALREGDSVRFVHAGLDPRTGRPLRWEQSAATDLVRRRDRSWGTPLWSAGAWWYPVLGEGIVRVQGPKARDWRCDPGPLEEIGGKVVCVERRRLLLDGRWRRIPPPPLYPPFNASLTGLAAAHPGGGLVVLRRDGGTLPGVDAPPARLPSGRYSALAALPSGLHAIAEERPPRLVPVEF